MVAAPTSSFLNANSNTAFGGFSISCASVSDPLVLQVNINPARAAKNLGTAAGVNSFDSRYLGDVEGTVLASSAIWRSASAPGAKPFLRFYLGTGDLVGSAAFAGPFSPISLALPATELEDGSYGELLTRGSSEFGSQDAKSAPKLCGFFHVFLERYWALALIKTAQSAMVLRVLASMLKKINSLHALHRFNASPDSEYFVFTCGNVFGLTSKCLASDASFSILLCRKRKRFTSPQKDLSMKTVSLIKAAFAASLAALLAACGGGSDSATPPANLPEVAWASPAVFVTPGSASKTFALVDCRRLVEEDYVDLYKASLTITSAGDLSISAATTTTGTVSTLWSLAMADAKNVAWSVSGNTLEQFYAIRMRKEGRTGSSNFDLYGSIEEFGLEVESYEDDPIRIFCNGMTDKLSLQMNIDKSRVAKNIGTVAGITQFDDYIVNGSIESGIAAWSNPASSPDYRQLRFNLATGDLSSSSSTTGTFTPLGLTLPSTELEFGNYGEALIRADGEYDYKDAKLVCLEYDKQTEMLMPEASGPEYQYSNFTVAAFGNRFAPKPGSSYCGSSGR